MNLARSARAVALASAVVIAVAACGGGPGGAANDPSGVVTAAFAAAQSGGLAKLSDFACAAHKDDVATALGGAGDLGALTAAGLKIDDILGAMSVSVSNLTTKEVSRTDTAATVHVTGDMAIKIDPEKFKTIAKTMFAAQGLPADDTTINAMVSAMSTQLSTTQKVDEDIAVVNEGGKWLICQ
jgi:hypothetical protein